jgi:hypothetical protein
MKRASLRCLIVNNASARGVMGTSRERRSKHRKAHMHIFAAHRPKYVPMGNAARQRYSRSAGLPSDFAMAKA